VFREWQKQHKSFSDPGTLERGDDITLAQRGGKAAGEGFIACEFHRNLFSTLGCGPALGADSILRRQFRLPRTEWSLISWGLMDCGESAATKQS